VISSPPDGLPRARPPCSQAEATAAHVVAARLTAAGFDTVVDQFRAPASNVPVRLAGALLRLGASVLIVERAAAAAIPIAAVGVACELAVTADVKILGPRRPSCNAVGRLPTPGPTDDPPLVVVAPLDSGGPGPSIAATRLVLAVALVAAGIAGLLQTEAARMAAMFLGTAAMIDLGALARGELVAVRRDDFAALTVLVRVAALAARRRPVREVWLVAAGASSTGEHGFKHFLRRHDDVARRAWVVCLGPHVPGELTLVQGTRGLIHRRALQAVVRAFAGAAVDTGDLVDVTSTATGTTAQAVALARRLPAVTLAGGGADRETIVRVARIIHRVARTSL
jgi:hypothetical protein